MKIKKCASLQQGNLLRRLMNTLLDPIHYVHYSKLLIYEY